MLKRISLLIKMLDYIRKFDNGHETLSSNGMQEILQSAFVCDEGLKALNESL